MPFPFRGIMLTIPSNTSLFICQYPINIGKSFEGLSKLVRELFPEQMFTGAFFIFLNRKKDHMKVLLWDHDGWIIWFKRLEKGTFAWKWESPSSLDRKTFLMLLEGIIPKRIHKRFSL